MHQRSLDEYFTPARGTSRSPNGLSLLDLPPPVRRFIYIFAGLVRVCPIDLNLEGFDRLDCQGYDITSNTTLGPPRPLSLAAIAARGCSYRRKKFFCDDSSLGKGLDCLCSRLPLGILYTCRTISQEARAMMYSENRFIASMSGYRSFLPLMDLTALSLASLTSLTITVNEKAGVAQEVICMEKSNCRCHTPEKSNRLQDLGLVTRHERYVLKDWENLVRRLAKYISPLQLRLCVISDSVDHDVALRFLSPLMSLPKLVECSIRLNARPNIPLQSLAQDVSRRLTGQVSPNHFRFGDLPNELQIQVLRHTDLICPGGIEWDVSKTKIPDRPCCRRCSDALGVCCCWPRHSAYTQNCKCWKLPMALFSVDSRIRKHALRIFYSENCWVIDRLSFLYPPGLSSVDIVYGRVFGLLKFLSSVPPQHLHLLRRIKLVVHGFDNAYSLGSGRREWTDTVTFLKQYLQTSKLCLRIDLSQNITRSSFNMTKPEAESADIALRALYRSFLEILPSDLQDLGLALRTPFSRLDNVQGEMKKVERKLAEFVLGPRLAVPGSLMTEMEGWKPVDQRHWLDTDEVFYGPDGTEIWPVEWKTREMEPYLWREGAWPYGEPWS